MNTILVPLDGSPVAEQVLPYAQALAPLFDAKVHLLRVLSEAEEEPVFSGWAEVAAGMPEPLGLHTDYRHDRWDMRRQHAEGYVDTEVIDLRAVGVDAEATVASGSPADSILDFANHEQATLIAMATHGYSGLKRWAIGSVTDQVVQAARCPVFLVRDTLRPAPDTYTIKRILVPLDHSALARKALPLALTLAQHANADVFLLQVVPPMTALAIDEQLEAVEIEQARCDEALQTLTTLAEEFGARYQVHVTPIATAGYVTEEIVFEAGRQQIDLIVMSIHGYHGIRRWVLGSVADKVLHATATPLLLVRPATG